MTGVGSDMILDNILMVVAWTDLKRSFFLVCGFHYNRSGNFLTHRSADDERGLRSMKTDEVGYDQHAYRRQD